MRLLITRNGPSKVIFCFLSIQVDFKPQIRLWGEHMSEMDASNIKYAFLHYQNYLKSEKNSKFYSCFIFGHYWWILRLFRTFGGLYFAIGRSYRQNNVEIRDLHTRNTQKEMKIHKSYMVQFWPPPRNRPKMGFLDHYWNGSKGVPFDSEFQEL